MTDDPGELSDFAGLRRVAIDYAQQASGKVWTDYNLHDPGVTLLEQSCFALSELAYQTDHQIRDLLTDPEGNFNFHDLALFAPRKVLGTDPVTTEDLAVWLSACPEVASVSLTPGGGAGLYDLLVVPVSEKLRHEELSEGIAAAFDEVRPLCCDRAVIRVARSRAVTLIGQVEMMPEAWPELVAAQIYHAVSLILRGAPHGRAVGGVTRRAAYAAPELLLTDRDNHESSSLSLDSHLGSLKTLPGVRDIGLLRLDPLGPQPAGEGPFYYASELPQGARDIGLVLTLNGVPVTLDPARLHEEFVRLAAERIGLARHHLDAADWQVMRPGQRREFTYQHVDSLLPAIYRATATATGTAGGAGDAGLLAYRHAIDGHLAGIARDLADLPRFFTAEDDIATQEPQAWRRKLALLDYLIALQGEEMPANRHSGLHSYFDIRARRRFELEWRLRYLYALPRLNAARLTGPGRRGPGGFLGRIALLADLDPRPEAAGGAALARHGLRIAGEDESGGGDRDAEMRLDGLPDLPPDPLDMLGAEEDAEPLAPGALRDLSPWARDGAVSSGRFLRLIEPQSLFLAPHEGGWLLLFDDRADLPPLFLARFDDRPAARRALSRLRASWRALHRESDSVTLVEDILLRGEGSYRPHSAWLVLAGWTVRGTFPAFRRYVGQLIEEHAPAHLLIRPLWLSFADTQRFGVLRSEAAGGAPGACAVLRDFLSGVAA